MLFSKERKKWNSFGSFEKGLAMSLLVGKVDCCLGVSRPEPELDFKLQITKEKNI